MKKHLLSFLFLTISLATAISQTVVLQREAPLMDQNYVIDGTAFLEELDNGDLQLRLTEDYSTPVGPDVRLYLSNSLSITGALEVADLSDINHFDGAMTFDVAAGTNIEDYQFVVFFCLSFNQLWASGEFGATVMVNTALCEETSTSSNGTSSLDICPSDGTSDVISLSNTGTLDVGVNYAYLITDENEVLEEVVMTDTYDFEGSTEETQRVYGISYEGALDAPIGLDRMQATSTGCFIHSDANTFLTITKEACPPDYECLETSTSSNGQSTVEICPTDGNNDIVNLNNNFFIPVGINYAYIITDANEIVEDVIFTSSFNFEGTDLDEQRVYGVNYDGTLNIQFGQNRMNTIADGDCTIHSSSSDYLTILKTACIPPYECQETSTSTTNGVTEVDICPTDGQSDLIDFRNNVTIPAGDNYAYLVTDINEIVLEVHFTASADFEGSGLSEQRVYGVNFDGTLDVQIGQIRTATTATECHIHSDGNNFLTVLKTACPPVFDCLASSTSSDGDSEVTFCSDAAPASIALSNSINIGAGDHYAYLVTDENEILEEVILEDDLSVLDLPIGTIRVYGIHYDGTLNTQIGQSRLSTTATECHEHSNASDFLTLTIEDCTPPPYECMSSTTSAANNESTISICPSDGDDDIITIQNSLNLPLTDNYAYLITDANEILQEVIMLSSFNFEGSGDATQRIYGINYDGTLDIKIGEIRTATTASECTEHSSATTFLTITKDACPPVYECAESLTATTDWASEVDICSNDGEEDNVELRNTAMILDVAHYAYLITDENEILQEVVLDNTYNFEGSGDATQRVYGINFDGTLDAQVGEIRTATTATGCFFHSGGDIFLTITKGACPPPPAYECAESLTATTDWASEVDICPNDGAEDDIELRNSAMVTDLDHYVYLITDENEIVQEVIIDNNYDFEGTSLETQRVYGINFDGTLDAKIGEIRTATTASGCFIHSGGNIFLTITKNACVIYECAESLTATTDWASEVDICPNDGINNQIELRNSAMVIDLDHYVYLITDENEIVQEVVMNNMYNFEGTSLATQRVYGINFDGTLDAKIGEIRTATTASGCFIHSGGNIFLTITKNACTEEFECQESAVASTAWVTNIDICATDGDDDDIYIQNNIMTVPGANYVFLITDTNEVLQEILLDSIFNFEGTGEETQRVYGMSYSGELDAAIGEDRKNTSSTDCFIHSSDDLFITINKTVNCATAVDDNVLANEINVFPNPAADLINISIDTEDLPKSVSILNIYGNTIIQQSISDRQLIIDTDRMVSGSYIIRIEYADQVVSKALQIIK